MFMSQENGKNPFHVGKSYFVRTVTYHLVGTVKEIKGDFIVFKEKTISWIADTERFMAAINEGSLREVEPVDVGGGVNMNSITDYFEWVHALPRTQI